MLLTGKGAGHDAGWEKQLTTGNAINNALEIVHTAINSACLPPLKVRLHSIKVKNLSSNNTAQIDGHRLRCQDVPVCMSALFYFIIFAYFSISEPCFPPPPYITLKCKATL